MNKREYYLTLETADGKIETINGVSGSYQNGHWLTLIGDGFEIHLSPYHYKFIEVREGSL